MVTRAKAPKESSSAGESMFVRQSLWATVKQKRAWHETAAVQKCAECLQLVGAEENNDSNKTWTFITAGQLPERGLRGVAGLSSSSLIKDAVLETTRATGAE